jgi:hypothetical protein
MGTKPEENASSWGHSVKITECNYRKITECNFMPSKDSSLSIVVISLYLFWYWVLRFGLRVLCLLCRYSDTSAMPLALRGHFRL